MTTPRAGSRRLAIAAVAIGWLGVLPHAAGPQIRTPAAPRLVVFLVVDQFRADYATMYGHQWTRGLRRLFDGGAVFTDAAFPFAGTWTCTGHATIGTGAQPRTHGIPGNTFYDRTLRRTLPCAQDPDAIPVTFGGAPGVDRLSSRALLVPTFAEELARQAVTAPAVVAVAQKPRSALMVVGRPRSGAIVVWQESEGAWATSTAYTRTPWRDVDSFVRARPMHRTYGQAWTRLLPLDRYLFVDDGPGEGQAAPRGRTFPHPVASSSGKPDAEFLRAWLWSPLNDAFVTDLAIHLLRSRRLGSGAGIDVLALSLATLDHIGHEYGPRSHEVQDVLARIDVAIGRLLDALDAAVGAGGYVLALSSDHGVPFVPEQQNAEGRDAGRISSTALRRAADRAVADALGLEKAEGHVSAIFDNQISFVPGLYESLRQTPNGVTAVGRAIAGVAGVGSVYSADDILGRGRGADRLLAAIRMSYVPGRSGEFVVSPRREWVLRSSSGTTHGTVHDYDQRVPLVLFGAGIRPGRYGSAATPADIAPTLAALSGITMPRAEGRILAEAVAR